MSELTRVAASTVLPNPGIPSPEKAPGPESPGAFGKMFSEAVRSVENYQKEAEGTVNRFLSGQDEEIHKVAIATQQAELSFELFLQMKNKVVQAYQEIMRIQL